VYPLPPVLLDKLVTYTIAFDKKLKDAASFDAWHHALMMHARCYRHIFEGRPDLCFATDTEFNTPENQARVNAASIAAKHTLLNSLDTSAKILLEYNTTPELYCQLVTRYGTTGLRKEIKLFDTFMQQTFADNKADFGQFEANFPAQAATITRLFESGKRNFNFIHKLVYLRAIPSGIQSQVIADLAGRYASVSEIPSFDNLGKRVRVALASSTVAVNTVQQARHRSGGRKKKWVPHGKCKHCGQYGHKHNNCPKKPQEVATVQILSPYVNTTSVKTKNFLWDGGSQIHVTNNCSLFPTFVNKPLPAVLFGGHKIPATGTGSIPFKRPDGT
ncbi:hypothetical protein OIO90_006646, partial [Microbotryomycetes sp. JL221]